MECNLRVHKGILPLIIIFLLSIFSNLASVYCTLPLLSNPNPQDGSTESDDGVYLQIHITSKRVDVENCIVKFYFNGEFIAQRTTGQDGVALIDIYPEIGTHTWYIIAEKSNYTTYQSPSYSFYYHPNYDLKLESVWGKIYGEGEFPSGDQVSFGVTPSIIYPNELTRYVFLEWTSTDEYGYNGPKNEHNIHLNDDVKQKARWETQHYVNFSIIGEGEISANSGWYQSGSIIEFDTDPDEGFFFTYWEGTGSGSYSGNLSNTQIQVFGPITQKVYFSTQNVTLFVSSEIGQVFGSSEYQPGTQISFGLKPKEIYLDDKTRIKFTGWQDNQNQVIFRGANNSITLNSNTVLDAKWVKQYYVELNTTGGSTNTSSGWYDENSKITFEIVPDPDKILIEWLGRGDGSYNGTSQRVTLTINSPINQNAIFENAEFYKLSTITSFETATGTGTYKQNELVEISINNKIHLISDKERAIFTGWTCTKGEGYTGPLQTTNLRVITETVQTANWKKQYYVLIQDNNNLNEKIQGWYPEGSKIQLNPQDNSGYIFKEWTGTGEAAYLGKTRSQTITITSPITQTAIYEEKTEPDYRPYYILGAFLISSPLIGKGAIQVDYNSQKNKRAKKEYKESRGTEHKNHLKSIMKNIEKEINENQRECISEEKQKTKLEKNINKELEKIAVRYLFDKEFIKIPGIGTTLKNRIDRQVFNGSLDSLKRSYRVQGIGPQKSSDINSWVSQQKSYLPRLLSGNFPGKRTITEQYNNRIKGHENKIQNNSKNIDQLNKLNEPVKLAYDILSNTQEKTFRKSYNGDIEASEKIMIYHLGVYPEWEQPPNWLVKVEKRR